VGPRELRKLNLAVATEKQGSRKKRRKRHET